MSREDIALLGDLAQAFEAHDLSALATRIAAALAPRATPLWVEVATRSGGSSDLACARAGTNTQELRSWDQALASAVRSPSLLSLPLTAPLNRFVEVTRARADGARLILFLPAYNRGACTGQVVAAFGEARVSLPDPLLEAMARIVSASVANVALIARLAGVSRRAHRTNRHLREELSHAGAPVRLIGAAPAFRQAVAAADAVAPYPTPVLLRGESGTGKELLALHVHEQSARARQQFLKVNCGAIPDGLVEAELFGHERGAFTGAVRRHEGIFERARGGSVLLDEIAELPLGSQVKILRVLQSGEYQRVGGQETLRADVRIIAATHRDLEEMVTAGVFRADLFFRLDVFPIVLPPLRERIEDLSLIAAALLQRLSLRLGRAAPPLEGEALSRLEAYAWPGNVRELENVLERALILSSGARLEIPELARGADAGRARGPHGHGESLTAATRHHIEGVLRACGGRIYGPGGAAERLGLPPSTLQSKMLRVGVSSRARRGR